MFQLIRLTSSTPTKSKILALTVKDVGLIVDAHNFDILPPLEGGGIFQFRDSERRRIQVPVLGFYFLGSNPRPTLKTWPSGWRRCISRTFHGISVGGNVISSPAATHCLCISSTSSTQTDI